MRYTSLLLLSLVLVASAFAKEPKAYQDGKLLQMDSVQCGMNDKDARKGKTHELLCQEYVVQTDQVVYHIRPKDEKHPTLLPIGETATFRLENTKMLLRVDAAGGKEREFLVVSVKPRGDNTAAAQPSHLNHLQ
jgi:hypothetical protein